MVEFLDFSRQHQALREGLLEAFARVLDGGSYILGEEVRLFEQEFASFLGAGEAVGVASGTDALLLSLKALGVGEGDEVVAPAFTAPPTVVAVALSGAVPVLADVRPSDFNVDPDRVEEALTERTRAVIPVHLYGSPADLEGLEGVCSRAGLPLVEDACQAHGARLHGRSLGTWGRCGCFSFYPTKNLGGLGDGGMVATGDPALASRLRSIRDYGRKERDLLGEIGYNSRLDELQAALLRVKLERLEEGNRRRRDLAAVYLEGLAGLPLCLPPVRPGALPAFHLFCVSTPERDRLSGFLAGRGIRTLVHYPTPIHLQPAFARLGYARGDFPVAERAAAEALSLPLYPELEEGEAEETVRAVREFFAAG
jgi:dTDP-4-amino-4,6-dideoxygalactose transaminase